MALALVPQSLPGSAMSSESSKKRKPKVIRTDGGLQEGKRGKADADQVGALAARVLLRYNGLLSRLPFAGFILPFGKLWDRSSALSRL